MTAGADNRADAPLLPVGSTSHPTPNTALTVEVDEPGPGWLAWARTAWWKFDGFDGQVHLDTSATVGGGDIYIAVYRDTGTGLELTPTGTAGYSDHSVDVQAGSTYYVQVGMEDGWVTDADYVLSLTVSFYRTTVLVSDAAQVHSAGGFFVGDDTALTTIDEETYAEFSRYTWVGDEETGTVRADSDIYTARLQPADLPAGATVVGYNAVVTARYTDDDPATTAGSLYVAWDYDNFVTSDLSSPDAPIIVGVNPGEQNTAGWTTTYQTRQMFTAAEFEPFTVEQVRAGGKQLWLAGRGDTQTSYTNVLRVTRVALEVLYTVAPSGGLIVTRRRRGAIRQLQRGDAHGMSTATRALQHNSTQGSLRNIGFD